MPITTSQLANQRITLLEMNKTLQRLLKLEIQQQLDEKTISGMDSEIKELLHELLKKVMQFMKFQSDYKDKNLRAKGFLINRIAEVPFNVDPGEAFSLKTKGLDAGEVKDKKVMAKAISIL